MASKNSPAVSIAVALFAVYHAYTLVVDWERWWKNVQLFQARPNGVNFIRVLAAEGVLIKDLGLGA